MVLTKLVRDNIPAMNRDTNRYTFRQTQDPQELLYYTRLKIEEEIIEALSLTQHVDTICVADFTEEIADVLEITDFFASQVHGDIYISSNLRYLLSLKDSLGISDQDVVALQLQKKAKKWWFTQWWIMTDLQS